jgi:hypothetical protein
MSERRGLCRPAAPATAAAACACSRLPSLPLPLPLPLLQLLPLPLSPAAVRSTDPHSQQEDEIEAATWLPLSDYMAQDTFQAPLYAQMSERMAAYARGEYSGMSRCVCVKERVCVRVCAHGEYSGMSRCVCVCV